MSLTRLAEGRAATEDAIAVARNDVRLEEARKPGGDQPAGERVGGEAPETPTVPTAQQAQANFQSQLLAYVPTDAIAGYVALTAAFSSFDAWWVRLLILAGVAATAPLWIVIAYRTAAQTEDALRKWPVFQIVVGTAAFLAWSTSVPDSLWQKDAGLPGIGGVAIGIAFSFFVGLLVQYYAQQHRIPARTSPATT
jgi:hypothetical protein